MQRAGRSPCTQTSADEAVTCTRSLMGPFPGRGPRGAGRGTEAEPSRPEPAPEAPCELLAGPTDAGLCQGVPTVLWASARPLPRSAPEAQPEKSTLQGTHRPSLQTGLAHTAEPSHAGPSCPVAPASGCMAGLGFGFHDSENIRCSRTVGSHQIPGGHAAPGPGKRWGDGSRTPVWRG